MVIKINPNISSSINNYYRCSSVINNQVNTVQNTQTIAEIQPKNKKTGKILAGVAIGGAVFLGAAMVVKSIKKPADILEDASLYRKNLLKSIAGELGIDPSDTTPIRSIMDKNELFEMLNELGGEEKAFCQGARSQKWVQDTNTMENIENCSYRANLHIHTVYSDGKMTVRELLDSAAEYASKVRKKLGKDTKYPFTIAITDHDSVEGCREAVKIIAKNPKKYENLKVVLGCELSTFHDDIPAISRAHRTHLLAYNINPFEGDFVDLLKEKHQRTFDEAKRLIEAMNQKMKSYWDFNEINYNLDEAKSVNWCIRDGLNGINFPLKDYFQFRKIYHETAIHNKELQEFLSSHNLTLSDIPFESTSKNVTYIHKKVTQGENMPYWNKYLISLKWEILKKIHGDDFMLTKENYKEVLSEIDKYFEKSSKNLQNAMDLIEREYFPLVRDEENQIFDFTKTVQKLSKNKDISLCLAHPAFIKSQHCDVQSRQNFITELFKKFKEIGMGNSKFYEKVYPYFNNGEYCEIDDDFLSFIQKEADKNGFIPSGSLDNHGKKLFFTE